MISSHAWAKSCSSRKISGKAERLPRGVVACGGQKPRKSFKLACASADATEFRVLEDYCDNFRNHTQIGVSCLLQGGASLLNVFASCYCLDLL